MHAAAAAGQLSPRQMRLAARELAAAEAQLAAQLQKAKAASLEREDVPPAVLKEAEQQDKELLSRSTALQQLNAKADACKGSAQVGCLPFGLSPPTSKLSCGPLNLAMPMVLRVVVRHMSHCKRPI